MILNFEKTIKIDGQEIILKPTMVFERTKYVSALRTNFTVKMRIVNISRRKSDNMVRINIHRDMTRDTISMIEVQEWINRGDSVRYYYD